ncbi:MAG: septum formation family protein [Nocardioidaceae bacterium]
MIRRIPSSAAAGPARHTVRRSPRRLCLAALTVAAMALLAGCGGTAGSPAGPATAANSPTRATDTSKPPPPPPPEPKVDTCRNLSYGAIGRYSNTTPTTPCKKGHTAYTFAVAQLPTKVLVKGVGIGNPTIQDAASGLCHGAFPRFIGGDARARAMSRLTVTYFLPQQKGFDRGAHWVRCDVIALQAKQVLSGLPMDPRHLLDHPRRLASYTVCSKGAPGAAGSMLVICSQPHSYRAVAALQLGPDKASYPSSAVTKVDGQKRCQKLVSSTVMAGGGYSYGWTYPTASDWQHGQRFGYCWSKTTS